MTHEQHQNVSSLVSDLVQMAEATRRLPEVERELADMRETARRDGDTIARLEIKLQQRSQELDALHAKLRSVEAERDDAGFRELEAQDKVAALITQAENMLSALGQSLAAVKADSADRVVRMTSEDHQGFRDWQHEQQELAAKREAEAKFAEASQRAPDPIVQSDSTSPEIASFSTVTQQKTAQPESLGSGQSEADPIAASADVSSTEAQTVSARAVEDNTSSLGQREVPPPASASPNVANFTSATSSDGANSPGRYFGKKYRDHPYYVSEASWLANGGTLEDYYYPQAIPAA